MCIFLTISQPTLRQEALIGGKTSLPAPLQKDTEREETEKHKKIEILLNAKPKNVSEYITIYTVFVPAGVCIFATIYTLSIFEHVNNICVYFIVTYILNMPVYYCGVRKSLCFKAEGHMVKWHCDCAGREIAVSMMH